MALKCIANILLLKSNTRQKFVQKENAIKVANKLTVFMTIISIRLLLSLALG